MSIYVIEVPHTSPVKSWVANDKDDLLNILRMEHEHASDVVWEKSTPREQMEQMGYDTAQDAEDDPEGSTVCQLLSMYGLDANIYKTNSTWKYDEGIDGWVTKPQDELEAYLDYNGDDLSRQVVYWSDHEALEAYRAESNWNCHGGIEARARLYDRLVDNDICPELIEVTKPYKQVDVYIDGDIRFILRTGLDDLMGDDNKVLYEDERDLFTSHLEMEGVNLPAHVIDEVSEKMEGCLETARAYEENLKAQNPLPQ